MDSKTTRLAGRPLIIGEVLFDCFDDGREVLGGAPFNVAWHLQAFGLRPLFISRIGEDPRGEQISEAMTRWGMDRSGLQYDPLHPTGMVEITMQDKQHSFSILADQAYDYIDADTTLSHPGIHEAALCYSGSLIERAPASRATVAALRARGIAHFIDVNLRTPWWQRDEVLRMLSGVRWAKLNEDELAQLGFAGAPTEAAERMRQGFGMELLVLTMGAEGALLLSERGCQAGEPVPVSGMVDTVGAGDAFTAVTILGLMRGWPQRLMLQRALAFASAQCEVQGATREDRQWYQQCMAQWGES